MYKQIKNIITNNIESVQRLSDGAFIPFNQANTDYQEYIAWTKASPKNVAVEAD